MRKDVPVIQALDLTKTYNVGGSAVHALDGVNLAVAPGEFLCIAGRSGSGKSTMLNLIAGLEPPTSGEILVDGQNIGAMSEEKRTRFRRGHVGFVFQSYNNLPQYTALENVALPLAIRGMSRSKRETLAAEALEQVGLQDHMRHRPTQLSGGQQQRVSIARAIVTHPPIVLADEPTGNLDSRTGAEIMELLCALFREHGTTFIMSSHDPTMTQYMDRTVRFADGRIQ